jgi:hypothetical protein
VTLVALIALPVAAALWLAGLVLFLRAELSTRYKINWTTVLVLVGAVAAAALPLSQIWDKFLIALGILPLLAVADVALFRSNRTFLFWLRACGFEVGTIFLVALGLRVLLDAVGTAPLVPR